MYKKKFFYSILFFSIIIGIFSKYLINFFENYSGINRNYIFIILRFFYFIILLVVLKNEKIINFRMVSKNFWVIFIFIFFMLFFTIKSTLTEIDHLNLTISNFQIGIYLLKNLTVGFFEEFFFRLLIFGYITMIFKNRNLFFQVIVTSLVFGFIHFINFFTGETDIYSAFIQFEFAFLAGVFFQILFIRLKNVYLISIIHGLFNYSSLRDQLLFKLNDNIPVNYSSIHSFISSSQTFIILLLLLIPMSYFYLKKANNELFIQSN